MPDVPRGEEGRHGGGDCGQSGQLSMVVLVVLIFIMLMTMIRLERFLLVKLMFEGDEQELPGAQHQEAVEQRLGDRVQLTLQTRFQVKLFGLDPKCHFIKGGAGGLG